MTEQSRLDVLEGRVEELSRNWDRLFADIGRVDQRVDALATSLSGRIDAVAVSLSSRIDAVVVSLSGRIDALEQKFDRRFEAIEQKSDRQFEAVDRRFDTIDRKMDDLRAELSKQFRWTFSTMLALVGMMLTVGAGVAAALLRN